MARARRPRVNRALIGFACSWLAAAGYGYWRLQVYNSTPGIGATAPARWPTDSGIARPVGRPTLLMFVHPQCACSRASLDELGRLLAQAHDRSLDTVVLFLAPASETREWTASDLWRSAATLPGVTVLKDPNGRESARFGVVTSGQTLLYDPAGELLFSGGITPARGHSGDNAGRRQILALLGAAADHGTSHAAVFGCPLRAPASGGEPAGDGR